MGNNVQKEMNIDFDALLEDIQGLKDKVHSLENINLELTKEKIELEDAKKQIHILTQKNRELEDKLLKNNTNMFNFWRSDNSRSFNKKENVDIEEVKEKVSLMSESKINEIVDNIMKNYNISYLPDWVERKLYINIITICTNLGLNFLDHFINNASIKVEDYQIVANLQPIKEENVFSDDESLIEISEETRDKKEKKRKKRKTKKLKKSSDEIV